MGQYPPNPVNRTPMKQEEQSDLENIPFQLNQSLKEDNKM